MTLEQTQNAAMIQTLFQALAPLASAGDVEAANTWSNDFWSLIGE
jgi:hypothetical protein